MHLSYKPPSSWKIMLWYEGCPRQFIRLKFFRELEYTIGLCRKGIILQGRQLPSGLPLIGQSFIKRKGYVPGESIHAPRQSNSPYRQTFRRSVFEIRRSKQPHSSILQRKQIPPGTCFTALLRFLKYIRFLTDRNDICIPKKKID